MTGGLTFNKVSTFPLRSENRAFRLSKSVAYKRAPRMFSSISTRQCDLCKIGIFSDGFLLGDKIVIVSRGLKIFPSWIILSNKCHPRSRLLRSKLFALVEDAEIFQCLSFSRTAETAYTMFIKDLSSDKNEIPREKSFIFLSFSFPT